MQIDTREVTKRIVSTIVGLGTAKIVNDIVQNNTDTNKLHQKVEVKASAFVMGAMAADKSQQYTDAKIDEMFDRWQHFKIVRKNTTAKN